MREPLVKVGVPNPIVIESDSSVSKSDMYHSILGYANFRHSNFDERGGMREPLVKVGVPKVGVTKYGVIHITFRDAGVRFTPASLKVICITPYLVTPTLGTPTLTRGSLMPPKIERASRQSWSA
jgi:hypothetical protein